LRLPFAPSAFDVVTVAFGLRNMQSWIDALREMRRVLRPGGHLLVLDFSLPGGLLRAPYRIYLKACLPRIAAAITGDRSAYEYKHAVSYDFASRVEPCATRAARALRAV